VTWRFFTLLEAGELDTSKPNAEQDAAPRSRPQSQPAIEKIS
jgi:hypothetical protein